MVSLFRALIPAFVALFSINSFAPVNCRELLETNSSKPISHILTANMDLDEEEEEQEDDSRPTRVQTNQKRLLDKLLMMYSNIARPVLHFSDTLKLEFGISLVDLLVVNVAEGYLVANLWIKLQWEDVNLKWDPAEYGGINEVSIPSYRIWRPDILLYNTYIEFDPTFMTNALVSSNGSVIYFPPGIFRASCRANVWNYPFDEHGCLLKFSSWAYNGDEIELILKDPSGGELTNYINKNSEWDLIGLPGKIETKFKKCCEEPYIDAIYTIQLKRRGGTIFLGASMILLISGAGIILSLFLAVDSTQRIGLGIVSFIGLIYVGISIEDHLGGKPTHLVSYFVAISFLTLISVISNGIIFQVSTRNPTLHKVPEYIKTSLMERFGETIRMRNIVNRWRYNSITKQPKILIERAEDFVSAGFADLIQSHNSANHDKIGDEYSELNDWQYLAIVLTRLQLIFFLFVNTLFFFVYFFHFTLIYII